VTVKAFRAQVLQVIDGDTVKLSVDLASAGRRNDADLGFHVYVEGHRLRLHYSFRLLGLNCAEHGTPSGDAATAFVTQLLPPGTWVGVQSVSSDKYDRYDALIDLPDGRQLNALLISTGHAAAWDGTGPKPVPPWPIPAGSTA
jgi:endonuclease YncB( thermonuclease family)